MAPPNVRFARDITRGCMGKDVVAHKRALSRAAPLRYPWHDFTTYAGDPFLRAFADWKKSKGMNSLPRIGRTAHEVLERTHKKDSKTEWAFDAVAIKLAADYWEAANAHPEQAVREAIVAAGFFWYAHRAQIAYSQARPFQTGAPVWVPSRWDCSAFVTNCHTAGGAPNPNGAVPHGQGYTGTLIAHGTRVAHIADLDPGDLVFYGHTPYDRPGFPAGSPTHVAMLADRKAGTPMVLSNGHYPMSYYPWDYRTDVNQLRHYKVA